MLPEPVLHSISGVDELAVIYVLQLGTDPTSVVETVDAVDPRYGRDEKAVIIISTQFGCPVGCAMCDAGGDFAGSLTAEQMLAQVRFVLDRRPSLRNSNKLKVHFARMGEPALNPHLLDAVRQLPKIVDSNALMPCIATVAPYNAVPFLRKLTEIRQHVYRDRPFQLQFSINTTDARLRRQLIPMRTLSLEQLAELGTSFHGGHGRKVVLNFALARGAEVSPALLRQTFNPEHFVIKLTPINPTTAANESGLQTVLSTMRPDAADALAGRLQDEGFDVIVSIGEEDEIAIGSNCGQLVARHRRRAIALSA